MAVHRWIIEKIGTGEMGKAYLAEDTQLDRKVAYWVSAGFIEELKPDVPARGSS